MTISKNKECSKTRVLLRGDRPRSYLMDYGIKRDFSIEMKDPRSFGEDDRMPLVSDVVFKTMLLNESRKKYACKLLSYILDVEYDYLLDNLELYKNEIDKDDYISKTRIGDFIAKINGTYISIEMNNSNTLERNEDYASKLWSSSVKRGKDYAFYPVIQINYNNFYFEGHDEIKEIYRVQNDDGEIYVPKIFIEIYLPNIKKKLYNEGEESLSEEEKCIMSMFTSSKSEARKLAKGDEVLMEYEKETEELEITDELFEAYDHELENYNRGVDEGFERGIQDGFEKGVKDGFEKGVKQRNIQIINTMLKNGMKKEEISQMINLPIEEISNMIKNFENEEK